MPRSAKSNYPYGHCKKFYKQIIFEKVHCCQGNKSLCFEKKTFFLIVEVINEEHPDGILWDMLRPLEYSCHLEMKLFDDEEG